MLLLYYCAVELTTKSKLLQVVEETSYLLGLLYFYTPDKTMLNTVTQLLLNEGGVVRAVNNLNHVSKVSNCAVYTLLYTKHVITALAWYFK